MQTKFEYRATLTQDAGGRFLVQFPELPEALTDGATEEEALTEAADALSEALAGRLADGEAIPAPVEPGRGDYRVAPKTEIALKVALRQGLIERGATVAQLAEALGIDHKEARRLLDPAAPTKVPRLAEALAALDYGVSTEIIDLSRAGRMLAAPRAARRVAAPATKKEVRRHGR